MAKNTATNYDAGHRWKSHADFYLICLPYNCKLYLFKHVHMHRQAFLCVCVCIGCFWLSAWHTRNWHQASARRVLFICSACCYCCCSCCGSGAARPRKHSTIVWSIKRSFVIAHWNSFEWWLDVSFWHHPLRPSSVCVCSQMIIIFLLFLDICLAL